MRAERAASRSDDGDARSMGGFGAWGRSALADERLVAADSFLPGRGAFREDSEGAELLAISASSARSTAHESYPCATAACHRGAAVSRSERD